MSFKENKHSSFTNFLLHLHPKTVNEQTLKYTRTFGLGGINALLFIILAFTGLLLRFSYVPIPENAYDSITSLQNNTLFGSLLRNIHHWSAMLMVITAFLHLLRVFYSQSIFYERKKNWHYGLILFVLVLFFNFTGYLLPWDQLSYWAVTIMTNIVEYIPLIGSYLADIIRGGKIVNENTLLNFYNFHTALLPILFVFFMVLHFWFVRKAKGVTVANKNEQKMVKVYPGLILKEIIVALFLIALIILFAIFFDAPMLDKANPLVSPNPSKAPWYFMGVQELLIHLHPILVTFVIPLSLITFLFYTPYIKIDKEKIGSWFYSQKGGGIIILSIIFSTLLTSALIIIFEYWFKFSQLNIHLFISSGIIPLLFYLVPALGFLFYLKSILKADKVEIIIAIMTVIFTSYIIMSIVGVWFRGESMNLIF
ncbi:MAG: cytochrome b N-terminal domain-containing protein [Bacteroidales bacterium]|nr:cytochrome b N-terminal domain-containing protein [Bacteroidales bacterium]